MVALKIVPLFSRREFGPPGGATARETPVEICDEKPRIRQFLSINILI